jgi:hypothetical protein
VASLSIECFSAAWLSCAGGTGCGGGEPGGAWVASCWMAASVLSCVSAMVEKWCSLGVRSLQHAVS